MTVKLEQDFVPMDRGTSKEQVRSRLTCGYFVSIGRWVRASSGSPTARPVPPCFFREGATTSLALGAINRSGG